LWWGAALSSQQLQLLWSDEIHHLRHFRAGMEKVCWWTIHQSLGDRQLPETGEPCSMTHKRKARENGPTEGHGMRLIRDSASQSRCASRKSDESIIARKHASAHHEIYATALDATALDSSSFSLAWMSVE
jgi:hypothetical protein